MLRSAVINAIRASYGDASEFRDCQPLNPEYVRGQLELAVNLLGFGGADDTESAIEALVEEVLANWG